MTSFISKLPGSRFSTVDLNVYDQVEIQLAFGMGLEARTPAMDPQWLTWAKDLHAIAQTGLTYAKDPYDIERYESVRLVAAQMMAAGSRQESVDFFVKLLGTDVGYATPKVDVRAVVFREGRLLLVKEKRRRLLDFAGRLGRHWRFPEQSGH